MFSSAAGPFGNRGQCDYAAANEVLNKLAIYLDRRWPGRVVSINWGPWAKTGMVSPELQRQFAERGVQLIPIQAGRRMFDRELVYGRKGEAEVILAGGAWGALARERDKGRTSEKGREKDHLTAASRPRVFSQNAFPLLQRATLSIGGDNGVQAVRTLDPSHDLFLRDHQLDGRPVLPLAMAITRRGVVFVGASPSPEVPDLAGGMDSAG